MDNEEQKTIVISDRRELRSLYVCVLGALISGRNLSVTPYISPEPYPSGLLVHVVPKRTRFHST